MSLKLFTDLSNLALNYQNKSFWATRNQTKIGHLIPIEVDEKNYCLEFKEGRDFEVYIKRVETNVFV